ncbi:hypothetical protein LSM04_002739 [Trypanosoma melophagium]|uniref:uncharacterized protein n=1 Tax=Trypanosoma melophagium TaxID=715481 RepID=UPI00351A0C5E|nr:hypothetical protein LSM04_002739 [Trypanosoma melophagium]
MVDFNGVMDLDVHVSFPNAAALQKFTTILVKALEAHRGHTVTLRDIPSDEEIAAYYSDRRAEGYRTPREVAEIKRQRTILEEYTEDGLRDVLQLQAQLQEVEAQAAAHAEGVAALKKKASVEHTQMQLHREVADKHEECEGVLETVTKLQEEMTAASMNEEALVEKEVAEVLSKANKKHEENLTLRHRAQQKEENALENEIDTPKKELSVKKSGGNAKIMEIEAHLDSVYSELEKELEALFRLEKFLATVNGEVRVHSDRISAQNSEKFELINAREKKKGYFTYYIPNR